MSKTRPEAVLKKMAEKSPDFGEKLYTWCKEGTYESARDQLADDGIKLGGGWLKQLHEFFKWWELQQEFSQEDSWAEDMTDRVAKKVGSLSPEELSELRQMFFTMKASNKEDAETWIALEKLKLDKDSARTKAVLEREKIELEKRRVNVLEENQRVAKEKITASVDKIKGGGLTAEALREIEEAARLL